MKFKSAANSMAIHIICVMVVVFFIAPFSVHAQGHPVNDKAKTKKATRVFYGQASFYSNKFNGRRTASGEAYDQKKLTCACNVLPLGTWIKVTNLKNGRSVIVKVNDRIHPKMKRIVDLSRTAAQKLGYVSNGLTRVKVELVDKKTIAQ
ncbi:MAG: septal ring lytic transglycosylase RlpA family protein [Ferruginibacter sp.]|nr:septal ring lytic transglycosylase RlpA family protein [Ferruginibacter sp.]